jgi:lipopolysaccharide transport system permease protein
VTAYGLYVDGGGAGRLGFKQYAGSSTWRSGYTSIAAQGTSYLNFAFGGLILWQAFVDGLVLSINTLERNRVLISKLRLSYYVLYLSKIIEGLANHFFRIFLFLILLAINGKLNFAGIFCHFYFGLALIFVGHFVGAVLSPLCLITQDIGKGIPFFLQILLWASPVFLHPERNTLLGLIYLFNPLSVFFNASRSGFYGEGFQLAFIYLWPCLMIPAIFVAYRAISVLIPIVNERSM